MLNLSRRGFLGLLGGAGAAAIVAPTYFFAPVGGWKSDVIVNPVDVMPVRQLSAWKVNVWTDDEIREVAWMVNGSRWVPGKPEISRVELVDTRPRMRPRFYA